MFQCLLRPLILLEPVESSESPEPSEPSESFESSEAVEVPDDENSDDFFFTIPGESSSTDEGAESDVPPPVPSVESVVASAPPVAGLLARAVSDPKLETVRTPGPSDPEFDSLPDAASQGSKMATWSIVLWLVGMILAVLPFFGFEVFSPMKTIPIFGLAFVLAVVSFFKKPSIAKSVVGTALSLVGLGVALFLGLVLLVKDNVVPMVVDGMEQVDGAVEPGTLGVGLPSEVVAFSQQNADAGLVDDGEGNTAEAPLPPESRQPVGGVNDLPASPGWEDTSSVLPPEIRAGGASSYRLEVLSQVWSAVEAGIGPGASPAARQVAGRAAKLLGYPMSVFEDLGPSVRLYLLDAKLSESGIDLSEFEDSLGEDDSALYLQNGVSAFGFAGGMGGPGPLPNSKISNSEVPVGQAQEFLEARAYGTRADGVGKFVSGMTPMQLRGLMDEALKNGSRVEGADPGGVWYLRASFPSQVGIDSSGLAVTDLLLTLDASGEIVDVYPY